jgi:hypothetical protein
MEKMLQFPHQSDLEERNVSLTGTISRVSANSLVYVVLDGHDQRSISFTPASVKGYVGQELTHFGFVPGRRVQLSWDPVLGKLAGPVELAKSA